ncbi:MAG TPA: hypothetical protein DCR93_34040, partial [Cytophagales bacterium]|nr:hypothetical protein [Cytophagales bacterium]
PPSRLKIWVYNIPGTNLITGSAPMLSKTFGLTGFNTDNNVVDFLLNANRITVSLNVVASLTKFLQPDITLFIRNGYTGNEIIHRVVYHELAHASHWRIVGNTFWQRYINYIISYGITNPPYGDGMGVNAELCGVGEMWGNYFGAVIEREVYGRVPSFTGTWTWLDEDEDWYNPGFLRKADSIADISTAEVFSSIGASTQSFNTLIYQLQLRTNFDNLVQEKYDFYSDWP